MRTLALFLALLVLLLLSLTGCAKEPLTEQKVQHLLDEMTNATQQRSVSGIMSHLSADVQIESNVDVGAGPQSIVFDKPAYKNMLEAAWAADSEHTYESNNVKIYMSDNGGSALVTSITTESLKIAGQRMQVSANEKLTIKMVEGTPKIVNIVNQPF